MWQHRSALFSIICQITSIVTCFVSDDDDDDAVRSASCSPRWIIRPNTHSVGALRDWSATTPQQCLETCVANTSCVAVDWDDNPSWARGCWMHDTQQQRQHFAGATDFEIVRNCYSKSSTLGRCCLFFIFFRSQQCCIFTARQL